jgi:hypothetical protein
MTLPLTASSLSRVRCSYSRMTSVLFVFRPMPGMALADDEKRQIQALDCTQPSFPLKKGRAATMTHDNKRNATTTLFAALDVKAGHVIGDPQHASEFRQFVKFGSSKPGAVSGRRRALHFGFRLLTDSHSSKGSNREGRMVGSNLDRDHCGGGCHAPQPRAREPRRSRSRCSSDNVLGGMGSPSCVRKSGRWSAALLSFGLKPRIPSRAR